MSHLVKNSNCLSSTVSPPPSAELHRTTSYRNHLTPGYRRSSKKATRAKVAGSSKLNPTNTASSYSTTAERSAIGSPPMSPPPLAIAIAIATHDSVPGPPMSPPPLVQAYVTQQTTAVTTSYASRCTAPSRRHWHVSLNPLDPFATAYVQQHPSSLAFFGDMAMQSGRSSVSASTAVYHLYLSPALSVHSLSNAVHTQPSPEHSQQKWNLVHEEMVVTHVQGRQQLHDSGDRTTALFFVDLSHASHRNHATAQASAVPYGHLNTYDSVLLHTLCCPSSSISASAPGAMAVSHDSARYHGETPLTDPEQYRHSPNMGHNGSSNMTIERVHMSGEYQHY